MSNTDGDVTNLSGATKRGTGIDSITLTVQVIGPDGEETQLVQFHSLTQITAIQKTIAGGFSLFKRRVYRGAQMINETNKDKVDDVNSQMAEEDGRVEEEKFDQKGTRISIKSTSCSSSDTL